MENTELYDLFFIMEKGGAIVRKYLKSSSLLMQIEKATIDIMEPLITSVVPAGTFPHEDVYLSVDEFKAIAAEDERFVAYQKLTQ